MMDKRLKTKAFALVILAAVSFTAFGQQKVQDDLYAGIEFSMPRVQEPQIPDYSVKITDFGAVDGGIVLNSKAFADAIDAAAQKGGGKVIIPRGIWLTGPITLKSNIELHTEQGALVIFSKDKSLYPLIETSFEGLNTVRCTSPIYGKGLENIAITGKGIFDGSGEVWRAVKKEKLTDSQWKKLVASGGLVNESGRIWYPSEQFLKGERMADMNVPQKMKSLADYGEIKDFLRPVMVSLVSCKKVLIDGPTFQNSPAWCLHPLMCEDFTLRNATVRNPWFSQNGDGIDIESCKNSIIHDSSFDVGDDAICIKSGKDKDGRERGIPNENLIVKNCIVYHGHGGVTVGSEMSGGVKNLHVSNCTFIGTDVGLRFKSNRGRGGVVEKVYISDVDMINIPTQAISFNLYYGGKSASEAMEDGDSPVSEQLLPVTEETPQFKDIFIRNVNCKGANQAIFLQGLPEMKLENVNLSDMMMEAQKGLTCIDALDVKVNNLTLITEKAMAINISNSRKVKMENITVKSPEGQRVVISGVNSGEIFFSKTSFTGSEHQVKIGKEVDRKGIKFE